VALAANTIGDIAAPEGGGGTVAAEPAPLALTAPARGERSSSNASLASTGGFAEGSDASPPRVGGIRGARGATDQGPSMGDVASSGRPSAPRAASSPTGGSTAVAEIPEVGPTSAVAQAEIDHGAVNVDAVHSEGGGPGLAIDIAAPSGPGGLGENYTPEVGISARQARSDSVSVELRSTRFLRTQIGGPPAASPAAVVATDAFSSRGARKRGETPAGGRGSPSPQTEEAIERGLAFLARYQGSDGGWSLQGFPEGSQLASNTAATALS